MKGFKRIEKGSLLSVSQSVIGSLQCAYQPRKGWGCHGDTVKYWCQAIGVHEDTCTPMLFNQPLIAFFPIFSLSGFQKYQVLTLELYWMWAGWLPEDEVTGNPGNDTPSEALLFCFTGSLQGCVLPPLIFVLYTKGWQSICESRFIVTFADDSVIISLLQGPWGGPRTCYR